MAVAVIEEIAVVLPINDEEELLEECLSAVDVAVRSVAVRTVGAGSVAMRPQPSPPRIRVIAVLDACTDGSADILRRWPTVEVIEAEYRSVGAARAHGIGHALATTAASVPARLWLANTDADSVVPPHWLGVQLGLARNGVELMLGSVRPNPRDLSAEQYLRWAKRSTVPADRLEVHGANLGMRSDVYLAAGGFPLWPEHEDVELVERMRAAGATTVATDACWVLTSARPVGRTPGGFAGFVREHY